MHSQDKAMLVALLCSSNSCSYAFTVKAMLVVLLCSRNCGRYAFTVQGYVSCFVMF
jgi:hypothetical protein